MEYGWVIHLVQAVMGGIIPDIGDKLGSKIGKRKIMLFGLRPKHTSILVTILTGISIAAVTLGVMSVLSEHVRIALFGLHQIQLQKAELEDQRDRLQLQAQELTDEMAKKNDQLSANELLLRSQEEQLDDTNAKMKVALDDLKQAQAVRDDMSKQLAVIQVAYDQATANLTKTTSNLSKAQEEINDLEQTKAKLTTTIGVLDDRIHMMNTLMQHVREGTVLFRVGEVLSSSILEAGQNEEQTRQEVSSFMSRTNSLIRQRLGVTDDRAVLLYISPDEFDATVQKLMRSSGTKLVRITAAGNIILGETALVNVQIYNNGLVYHKGDMIYRETIKQNDMNGNVEMQLIRFLHQVNQQAQMKGLLPDPLTGNVGAMTGSEMFEAIAQIKACGDADVTLEAVSANDVYTAGPLHIKIHVHPVIGGA